MDHTTIDQAAGATPDPAIRTVPALQPLQWLLRGAQDMARAPLPGLAHGLVVAAIGSVLLWLAWSGAHIAPALVTGFLLVAPVLAVGVYGLSRQIGAGEPVDGRAALRAWQRNGGSIALFGVLLAIALLFWERVSAIIFAMFYGGTVPDLSGFLLDVLFSGRYTLLVAVYVGVGALFALAVFTLSVVTLPLLLDRDVDPVTALITSARAVRANPAALALWAALIAALTAIGFFTWMVGLVFIFPWLAHASWHAYRDLVE